MKKEIFFFAVVVAFAFTIGSCKGAAEDVPATDTTEVGDSIDLILRVRQTSRLYTAEYQVHKIVTHEDVKHLRASLLGQEFDTPLSLGDRKVAIPIDVTLKAYIDFSNFSESQLEHSADGKKLHVILPDPKVIVTASKVDHASTRQFTDILRSDYSDEEISHFTEQGVQAILRQVPQLGILETARHSAAATLIPLFAQVGYAEEDIVITFRKDFTERDLPFYTESSSSLVREGAKSIKK
ncbi:MAG: DUF4230 domain-containing protein [Bacteroidaceae bacterium]|nr:DUF4230 domain-containing protein [Bacteroidaceae bacterium]